MSNSIYCEAEDHFKEHHLFYYFFMETPGKVWTPLTKPGAALLLNLLLEMDED